MNLLLLVYNLRTRESVLPIHSSNSITKACSLSLNGSDFNLKPHQPGSKSHVKRQRKNLKPKPVKKPFCFPPADAKGDRTFFFPSRRRLLSFLNHQGRRRHLLLHHRRPTIHLPHQAPDSFPPHHRLSSSGLGRGALHSYHQVLFILHFASVAISKSDSPSRFRSPPLRVRRGGFAFAATSRSSSPFSFCSPLLFGLEEKRFFFVRVPIKRRIHHISVHFGCLLTLIDAHNMFNKMFLYLDADQEQPTLIMAANDENKYLRTTQY
ncbi:uncharacterized protein LOC122019634 [Zingiber officinale]|uniref:uncharacterized protein LOC122019634 n=1 Tax=Zingiber officinale TaxID=94328 RepID=UPI001C4B0C2B|nr:uncharacterized protein LOC122019634 [Zingiber officinale]